VKLLETEAWNEFILCNVTAIHFSTHLMAARKGKRRLQVGKMRILRLMAGANSTEVRN